MFEACQIRTDIWYFQCSYHVGPDYNEVCHALFLLVLPIFLISPICLFCVKASIEFVFYEALQDAD